MRKLTEDQHEDLRQHLKQKNIEYVELYDEIYDHYASAFELGQEKLEDVNNRLDQTFTQEYIDDHRKQIDKRIFKGIRSVYKKEMSKFFRWPQIMASILSGLLIMTVAFAIPLDLFKFYILIPCYAIPMIPFLYFFIQEHRKLVPRNLKSASYQAMNKMAIIPLLVFNVANSITLFGDNSNQEVSAFILGLSIIILIAYDIITIKVFKQKIKYQMV
jgi:hypothetical protein